MLFDKLLEPIKNWFSSIDKIDNEKIVQLDDVSKPEQIEVDGALHAWNFSFDITIRNIKDLVKTYREAANQFEVSLAIDDIVNEAIVMSEDDIVTLDLDNIKDMSDNIKDKIYTEFNNIIKLLDFNSTADEIFKKWYIDGRLYYQNIIDPQKVKDGIIKLNMLSPLDIMRMKDKETKKLFYVWKQDEEEKIKHVGFLTAGTNDASEKIWMLPAQLVTFVPSGLNNAENTAYISYLHKSLKPLNQLKLIEDSAVIYRITRAPERRVFYIDVGRLPKTKAEAYVKKLINKFKNKLTYDSTTGQLSQKKDSMTMLEDFYLPSSSDQKGTKVELLQGGNLIDKIEDIKYFKRKLYKSLNVPISRIDQDDNATFNLGRSGELTREELKFTKWIHRLREVFAKHLFLDLLKKQVIFKKIISISDWENIRQDIKFIWATDSYYSQLKEQEILSGQVELAGSMMDYVGKYFSHKYIRTEIFKQTDEIIKQEDKLIKKELKDERYVKFQEQVEEDPISDNLPAKIPIDQSVKDITADTATDTASNE